MKNTPNEIPITSNEYWGLMRLLKTLETAGEILGSEQHDWQTIYDKLNYQCSIAYKASNNSSSATI